MSGGVGGQMGPGQSPLDHFRFPLEQQLMEIMRSAVNEGQDGHYGKGQPGSYGPASNQGNQYGQQGDDFGGSRKVFRGEFDKMIAHCKQERANIFKNCSSN